MASRPTVTVYGADGAAGSSSVALPGVFLAPVRPDVVHQVTVALSKNKRQPYSVNKYAGKSCAASSWGTGRAVSRIPRVQGGGTHRSGQGAYGNMCRGGRMFAPTKTWRKWHAKINVTQKRYAACSAIAASGVTPLVMARGHRVEDAQVDSLSVLQLAPGGHLGRFCVWTQSAFEKLDALYGTPTEASSEKTRHGTPYRMPQLQMANADLSRLINSDEVQSVVNAPKEGTAPKARKANPLKSAKAMDVLNPAAATFKKAATEAQATKKAKAKRVNAMKSTFYKP